MYGGQQRVQGHGRRYDVRLVCCVSTVGAPRGCWTRRGSLLTFLEDDNGGCLPAERHLGRQYAAEFSCSRREGCKEWPRGVESLVVRLLKTACLLGRGRVGSIGACLSSAARKIDAAGQLRVTTVPCPGPPCTHVPFRFGCCCSEKPRLCNDERVHPLVYIRSPQRMCM